MALFFFLVTLGYLMGSVSSAIIVCRIFDLPDPLVEGSKNPGATNVLRIAGRQYALLVMAGDLLKGTIPVLIAKALHASPSIVAFTALAAVIGHMYPLFFKFKGGKGVATAIGALLGLHFIIGILVAATWLLVAHFNRHASLSSIVALSLAPFYTLLFLRNLDTFSPLFFIALLVLFKHRQNIARLLAGTEPKINLKSNLLKEIMKSDTHPSETTTEPLPTQAPPSVSPSPQKMKRNTPAKKSVKQKAPAKPKASD